MKSADGSKKFFRDVKNGTLEQYLLKCLLFTSLEMQNHMRSFMGSDGRFYRNELCLDITNGKTLAFEKLERLEINEKEHQLIKQWENILSSAKKTKNYNSKLTYGVFQIFAELNTWQKNELDKRVYDYPELNGHINTMKTLIKDYYNTELVEILFKYEFLK